ncbi:nucleotidyl transferase AbiEii/AbiGii toxin family protein, partial [Bacteroidales bacterium OttesenSCG-928-I21]|nr:nucleotidyl transferase AbiEii/AbiGii toxin family protein [Bacteroidales bacterium OttesenSCG-928-I21]
DLFTPSKINKTRVRQKILQSPYKQNVLFEDVDQLHFVINAVKITFFQYPYPIQHSIKFENIITMPSLLSLAAMKAFALGRRAKWKDYVDLYFILRDFFTVKEIADEAIKLFGQLFSEKIFRQQLAFHKDIDYTEEVEFLSGYEVNSQEIKDFLIDIAIKYMI